MQRDYELMFIVRPDVDDEGVGAAIESVQNLVRTHGGTVTKTTVWGKRRLAYEVKHLRDGTYVILHLAIEGAKISDIERTLAIHETVFRHLTVLRSEVQSDETAEGAAEVPSAMATSDVAVEPLAGEEMGAESEDQDADALLAEAAIGSEEDEF